MRKTAFTLIEVLLAITIIAVIAALVFPAIVRSKGAAQESNCVQRLRQWHLAISLYRELCGDTAIYGLPHVMGLPVPTTLRTAVEANVIPATMVYCPSGADPTDRTIRASYFQMWYDPLYMNLPPGVGAEQWEPYVLEHQDNSVLIVDRNHQIPGTLYGSPLQTHRGIGLYLGGHTKTISKKGDQSRRAWWN